MKLPETKIESICDQKDFRQYLRQPHLDVKNKRLVATNGHVMAILNVELDEGDTSGPVPISAIKTARKNLGSILLDGQAKTLDGTFERPDVGKYPDYAKSLPKVPDREPEITFNAELLFKLAQAISANKTKIVSLWIENKESPIIVKASDGIGVGVLMPCRH